MNNRNFRRIFLLVLFLLVVSIITALAAVNSVPSSLGTDYSTSLTINSIKPSECNIITLTNLKTCVSGVNCDGTSGNDLMLGTPGADYINGSGGDDCILGGAGDDNLIGSLGSNDVCIGGPGNDTLNTSCEHPYQ